MEPIVERRPEHNGWEIRTADQLPGSGTVVTDGWLAAFGFARPTRFNIDKIIAAAVANSAGYAPTKMDARELLTPEFTRTHFFIPGGST